MQKATMESAGRLVDENGDSLLVPARMLNEWTYCPRLAVLEWVKGEWSDNADTVQGHRAHLKADTNRAPPLPAPAAIGQDDRLTTRRLSLGSQTEALTAKIDILELENGAVVPVEIKKGKRPHIEGGAHDPERVQLCAQGLLLRDAGYRCDEGAIWFAGSRERVSIAFDEALIEQTRSGVRGLLDAVERQTLPEPLHDSPKCTRCSLRSICLPDEVNWFKSGEVPASPPPANTPALPLYVQTPGAWIGVEAETLRISLDKQTLRNVPLAEVSELVLAGRVNLSTPAMHALLRCDIPVAWMSSGFWMLGSTGAQGPRSAATRCAQYEASADPGRRMAFAVPLIHAKVRNQRTILRRSWRGEPEARKNVLDKLDRIAKRIELAKDPDVLRGFEGEAAALYFRALPNVFVDKVAALPEFKFERRNRRPPTDPVNACLSFAYALLTRTWSAALSVTGLDPWKGLWHAERPGRPALALDMIEPYRPVLADSAVLTALNNGELRNSDFVFAAGGCNLNDSGRRTLIAAYERRLDRDVTHPVFGYELSMRRMLMLQARLLARYLQGELPSYPHYVPR